MEYTEEDLRLKYSENFSLYNRACNNIQEALTIFISEHKIPFLTISTRVKTFDSFYEKIDRKNYTNPFDDAEDFCGVRIILYYLSDIEKVNKIISKEFDVQNDEDKSEKLDVNEFGYRSYHFIIKIKDKWLDTPNYRGLKNIKIEIQVRTVLMHAWAEIEHKLEYKNKEQIPRELRRKLFQISAKLEEADSQFQTLDNEICNYKNELISKAMRMGAFTSNEFNLNTFQAFLDFYFPDNEKQPYLTKALFDKIKKHSIPLELMVEYAEKIKPLVPYIETKVNGANSTIKTTQANIMDYAVQALNDKELRKQSSNSRLKLIEEIEQLLK